MICKKQHMYCFLPFGFKNVIIFGINPSGFYSTLVGAGLEYANLICFDRGSWSDFETVMALCWRFWWITSSSDLRRASGVFKEVFKFWNFKASRFLWASPFSPLYPIWTVKKLLEEFTSLLVIELWIYCSK